MLIADNMEILNKENVKITHHSFGHNGYSVNFQLLSKLEIFYNAGKNP